MEKRYSYRAHAHWTMHKRGILDVEEIPRTINFAAPPEFGGEPGLWTPEHMLLGSVATCYVATFRAIAEASKFFAIVWRFLSKELLRSGKAGSALRKLL